MTRDANRMAEAASLLMEKFQAHASVTITYSRGSASVEGISATRSRTPFEVVKGEVMVQYECVDYIFSASDLVLSEATTLPQNGDRITEEASGNIYEVSIDNNVAPYEAIGPTGSVLRVHTKGPME